MVTTNVLSEVYTFNICRRKSLSLEYQILCVIIIDDGNLSLVLKYSAHYLFGVIDIEVIDIVETISNRYLNNPSLNTFAYKVLQGL